MQDKKIFGHGGALKQLAVLLKSGKTPPAMIFCGPEGVGKFFVAREFAKALNCEGTESGQGLFKKDPGRKAGDPALSPCRECVHCQQIENNVHPDVRVIDREFQAALLNESAPRQKALKIDTVRQLADYAGEKPILSTNKVFIVNDAHTLTFQAQNAMLKILEEPPPRTHFILVTSQRHSLLATIISRCQNLEFGVLSDSLVEEILTRHGISLDEASFLSSVSLGSVSTAFKIRDLIKTLPPYDPGNRTYAFLVSSVLPREQAQAREKANLMLSIYLSKMHKKWTGEKDRAVRADIKKILEDILKFKDFLRKNVMAAPLVEIAALRCLKYNVTLSFK